MYAPDLVTLDLSFPFCYLVYNNITFISVFRKTNFENLFELYICNCGEYTDGNKFQEEKGVFRMPMKKLVRLSIYFNLKELQSFGKKNWLQKI